MKAIEKPALKNGGVAQLGEHLLCKQGVRSSILLISTMRDKVKERTEKPKQELLEVVENGEVDGSACGIEVIDLEVKLDIQNCFAILNGRIAQVVRAHA